jgi:hypothetical protein
MSSTIIDHAYSSPFTIPNQGKLYYHRLDIAIFRGCPVSFPRSSLEIGDISNTNIDHISPRFEHDPAEEVLQAPEAEAPSSLSPSPTLNLALD